MIAGAAVAPAAILTQRPRAAPEAASRGDGTAASAVRMRPWRGSSLRPLGEMRPGWRMPGGFSSVRVPETLPPTVTGPPRACLLYTSPSPRD
eukprot:9966545-Alexandrium_andersonii.AAC.1